MHVLYEEGGKFLAGRILSEADASLQVELESGKRIKLKSALALLKFDKPTPAEMVAASASLAHSMDVNLAWEFAPDGEFSYSDVAREYFSPQATPLEQAAALVCLFQAPHYFRRAGKGRFKKADAQVVQQALAAIEKKKAVTALIAQWAHELAIGICPDVVRQQLYKILFKPDKNAPEYKAVVEASRATQTAPLALLQKAGAIGSAYEFHWQRFLFDQFPRGIGFPVLQAPLIEEELPLADVQAFSIDDSSTTEIDDALSVQGLGSGQVTLGIHIAAPALAITPQSAIDKVARSRLSTVYMPGHKITMLPDEVVQAYTLMAGRSCPAVSLYVVIDEATLVVSKSFTRLERVPIDANLRHDILDEQVTEQSLIDTNFWSKNPDKSTYYGHKPLSFLYRLACQLKAQREQVRGKPETFNRPDYNFSVAHSGEDLQGNEPVSITLRRRGAPLDLIVAEAMILANSTWGQWMASLGVPAIYRSQASLAPGVKVRMGTKALPHAGIGVPCYAWSTSPLRRYTDMVNQWQIIACAKYAQTAALAAPFKPKDAELFGIISSFDAAYAEYNAFQNGMERYWTLQYIKQKSITELEGQVIKEGMVRTDDLPLVLPVTGTTNLPRGSRVLVRLGSMDEMTLDIGATLVARLDGTEDADVGDVDDDDDRIAGPIAIALDVTDIVDTSHESATSGSKEAV